MKDFDERPRDGRPFDDGNEYNGDSDFDENESAIKRVKKTVFSKINRDHPTGVSKDEKPILDNPNIPGFFKLFGRNLNRLFSVNLMILLGNFPIFFLLLSLSGYLSNHTFSPYYQADTVLRGIGHFSADASVGSLRGIFSLQTEVAIPSTLTYILYAISALLIVTLGLVNIGTVYIERSMVREAPIFMWSDFWYAIKKNFRQGIIYGILDTVLLVVIAYDIIFFNINLDGSMSRLILFFCSACIAILYLFMRPYIYLMLITFDLSFKKLFKNALYFTVLGVKRNFMAMLGIAVVLAINYFFFAVYVPIGVILPFVIVPSLCWFISVYAAYPKIKEIMIDPYYDRDGNPIDKTAEA